MKKILCFALAAIVLAACNTNTPDGLPEKPQPIDYPTEKQEAVTNEFTLLKACIGKSDAEITALLTEHGFSLGEDGKYRKPYNGVTKTVEVYSSANVCMVASDSDYVVQTIAFGQWVNQFRQSAAYDNLVRASFSFRPGWGAGNQPCTTPEQLVERVNTINTPQDGLTAAVDGNDMFANRYSIVLFHNLNSVYLQISNPRVGKPSDDFTETDLKDEDLHKHILISRVDYLTFRHKGFYATDVSGKINSGAEIPFLPEYESPGDFGYIKLFYNDKSNLLLNGSIVWNGCGRLEFPESFRAGLPLKNGLDYPGQERFAFIGDDGKYLTVDDDSELRRIWQSVSKQKEFQHYFANSTKKTGVYLYAPSVGLFDPNVASYFVFTEQ